MKKILKDYKEMVLGGIWQFTKKHWLGIIICYIIYAIGVFIWYLNALHPAGVCKTLKQWIKNHNPFKKEKVDSNGEEA